MGGFESAVFWLSVNDLLRLDTATLPLRTRSLSIFFFYLYTKTMGIALLWIAWGILVLLIRPLGVLFSVRFFDVATEETSLLLTSKVMPGKRVNHVTSFRSWFLICGSWGKWMTWTVTRRIDDNPIEEYLRLSYSKLTWWVINNSSLLFSKIRSHQYKPYSARLRATNVNFVGPNTIRQYILSFPDNNLHVSL